MKNLKAIREEHGAGEWGTDKLTNKYKSETPGQHSSERIKENTYRISFLHQHSDGEKVHHYDVDAKNANDAHDKAHDIHATKYPHGDFSTLHRHGEGIRINDNFNPSHQAEGHNIEESALKRRQDMMRVTHGAMSQADFDAKWKKPKVKNKLAGPGGVYKNLVKKEDTQTEGLEDACWKGYEAIGTKQKNGRTVPNCVPKEDTTTIEKPVEEENDEQKNLKITKHEKAAVEAAKNGDKYAQQWHLAKVKALKAESVEHVTEAKKEQEQQKHLVTVTVSDPQHAMVSKRKQKIMKRVKVSAANPKEAVNKAEAHYKKHGFKVHDSLHHSVVNESLDTDEFVDSYDTSNCHENIEKAVAENSSEEEDQGLTDEDKAAIARIKTLIRLGLLDNSQMQIAVRVLRKLNLDQPVVSSQERAVLAELLEKLVGIVTGDDAIFRKIRLSIQQQ